MTKPFSFSDNSIDVIYSSHTFEHLTYEEAQFAFSECYRILKPAGIIRIIVPDFEELVNAYLSDKAADPKNASMKFHKNSGYFELPVPNSFFGLMPFYFKRKNNHQFLYDEMALRKQFEAAGFREISRKRFQESEIQNIKEIDIEKRFANAICLEAKK
ncbi:MAG TPA: methyltransferase domain-containing protein [Bacteroidia bacterium]